MISEMTDNLSEKIQNNSQTQADSRRKRYGKIMLFVVGWFTVPFFTGGIWYDLFGGLDAGEVWQRLTHPQEMIDALGVYTIAFFLFPYLPPKISKVGWGKKIFYFILFYFVLCRFIDFLF